MLPVLSRAILLFSLISSTTAIAETHMLGLVGQTCATWTANPPASGGLGLFYEQWVLGFLSGVSYAHPDHDPLNGMDAWVVRGWVDNYCHANPAANMADAATAFVRAHASMEAPASTSHMEAETSSPASSSVTQASLTIANAGVSSASNTATQTNSSASNSGAQASPTVSNGAIHAEPGKPHHPRHNAERREAHRSSRLCEPSERSCRSMPSTAARHPVPGSRHAA